MAERILVAVAWPYANGSTHIGQLAGCYLPADIFARYHRMQGNDVLMVSGSDAHGTPVTLTAEERGISPQQVFESYQTEFLSNWKEMGISFDLFTSTRTQNHAAVAQEMFLKLLENEYIYKDSMWQPYCSTDRRFLADRYVEGTCPHCQSNGARGDQCDSCGRTLDPQDLIGLVCKLCNNTPVIKETEHFFLKLSAFQDRLLKWVRAQEHWRPNVRNFTIAFIEGGLHDRAITRDIEWGVPVPLEGYEGKCLYVWFEAVIGYLSASKEWSQNSNTDQWKRFWEGDSRGYYFMGKDNIPFHSIIWPSMLMGYSDFNLPYNIPANEYLNLEGMKFSTSKNWAIWLPDYLKNYEPDPLRYVLAASMPETGDSDFSWNEYIRRNNDELVATYGNLIQRVLSLISRNFSGKVPPPGLLDDVDNEILEQCRQTLNQTAQNLEACHFKSGLNSAFDLAHSANKYLERKAPWRVLKDDRKLAGTTLWVCLAVINCLKTALYPFMPFSSEKLHSMLGFKSDIQSEGWTWKPDNIKSGQIIQKPDHLFKKLDNPDSNHQI